MNLPFQITPVVKNILLGLIILAVVIAALITIKDEISYQFRNTDDITANDLDQNEEECNVIGLNLHGTILTYLPPETLNDNGDVVEDFSAAESIIFGIKEAESNENIKAILLEVDSGGGQPVAGQEIALALKAAAKPAVALIRQMGASAAYLAASGADTVFASQYSDVGSIGVTMSYLSNYNKNTKEGLNYVQLSSGKFKDTGDPDKPLSQEEKDLLMRDVLKDHELFVKDVAENRHLPIEKVSKLADGSTMLGEAALANGLIDKLGTFNDVEQYLKDLIGEDPEYCWY